MAETMCEFLSKQFVSTIHLTRARPGAPAEHERPGGCFPPPSREISKTKKRSDKRQSLENYKKYQGHFNVRSLWVIKVIFQFVLHQEHHYGKLYLYQEL